MRLETFFHFCQKRSEKIAAALLATILATRGTDFFSWTAPLQVCSIAACGWAFRQIKYDPEMPLWVYEKLGKVQEAYSTFDLEADRGAFHYLHTHFDMLFRQPLTFLHVVMVLGQRRCIIRNVNAVPIFNQLFYNTPSLIRGLASSPLMCVCN